MLWQRLSELLPLQTGREKPEAAQLTGECRMPLMWKCTAVYFPSHGRQQMQAIKTTLNMVKNAHELLPFSTPEESLKKINRWNWLKVWRQNNCHGEDSLHKETQEDKWRDLLKPWVNKRNQAWNIQVITDVMTWHLLWHAFETGTLKDIHYLTGIIVPPGKKDSHFDEYVSHSEACRQARSQALTFRNNSKITNGIFE